MNSRINELIEALAKRSEILGYYQARNYDIEIIINDITIIKSELLNLINQMTNHYEQQHRQD